MKPRSPVLVKLAELFEKSAAGRHGTGKLDFQPDLEMLLRAAGCAEGEGRELAERDLKTAEAAKIIQLEYDRPLARTTILKVRLRPENECLLFAYLGRQSPAQRRVEWSAFFREAQAWAVPLQFADSWRQFCITRSELARSWRRMQPFKSEDLQGGRELLTLLTRILAWEGRQLVRWVSSVLCGDSKLLERRQKTLEALLLEVTSGAVPNYEGFGILPVPSGVTFHGPLRLRFGDRWSDFQGLRGPVTLSGADIERITAVESTAIRCLTVENATPFRSMAALDSEEILIHTSYPSQATLGLLMRLSEHRPNLEFWHFGDTDPKGFHILFDLRHRSGLAFRAFHMRFRSTASAPCLTTREREMLLELSLKMPTELPEIDAMLAEGRKGDFEQESLCHPPLSKWPFYPDIPDI